MKSITLSLILFATILAISKSILDNYSIEPFLESLKEEGLFDIILSIKQSYGQDVAVISCEELKQDHGGNCKKAVKDYMDKDKKIDREIIGKGEAQYGGQQGKSKGVISGNKSNAGQNVISYDTIMKNSSTSNKNHIIATQGDNIGNRISDLIIEKPIEKKSLVDILNKKFPLDKAKSISEKIKGILKKRNIKLILN